MPKHEGPPILHPSINRRESSTYVLFSSEITGHAPDGKEQNFPKSIYGVVLLAIALAPAQERGMFKQATKALFAVITTVLFLISIVMQIALCLAVLTGPLQADQYHYEQMQSQSLIAMISDAIHSNTVADELAVKFCESEVASVNGVIFIYYFVIFLWIGRMLQELSDTLWLMYAIWKVPNATRDDFYSPLSSDEEDEDEDDDVSVSRSRNLTDDSVTAPTPPSKVTFSPEIKEKAPTPVVLRRQWSGNEMVAKLTEHDKSFTTLITEEGAHITKLGMPTRVSMLIFLVFTRLMLYVMVQWVGIKFLVLARTQLNLIIKSLAFQYILTIPELIYSSTASVTTQKRVEKAKLHFRTAMSATWDEWLSSVVRIAVMAVGTALVFQHPLFADIMRFRYSCQEYARHHQFENGGDGAGWHRITKYLEEAVSHAGIEI